MKDGNVIFARKYILGMNTDFVVNINSALFAEIARRITND